MNTGKIVKFYITGDQLEKWLHQNKACYTGAFEEGNLLDNFVVDTPKGFAVFRESYVNCWTSRYYVEYAINRNGKWCESFRNVWKNWYDFVDNRVNV